MPNWCSTTYKCAGEPKDINALYSMLKYIDKRKTTVLKNGFGKWWLGNLVHLLGFDWEKYYCRGEITDYDIDGNVITIWQETAWGEQEGVREAIETAYPSIKVYYIAEEPGCGVFCTNDSNREYFSERYFLDSYEDTDYFGTIEEVADKVSEIVGYEVKPCLNEAQDALDRYVEEHEDEDLFYSLNEFEVA